MVATVNWMPKQWNLPQSFSIVSIVGAIVGIASAIFTGQIMAAVGFALFGVASYAWERWAANGLVSKSQEIRELQQQLDQKNQETQQLRADSFTQLLALWNVEKRRFDEEKLALLEEIIRLAEEPKTEPTTLPKAASTLSQKLPYSRTASSGGFGLLDRSGEDGDHRKALHLLTDKLQKQIDLLGAKHREIVQSRQDLEIMCRSLHESVEGAVRILESKESHLKERTDFAKKSLIEVIDKITEAIDKIKEFQRTGTTASPKKNN